MAKMIVTTTFNHRFPTGGRVTVQASEDVQTLRREVASAGIKKGFGFDPTEKKAKPDEPSDAAGQDEPLAGGDSDEGVTEQSPAADEAVSDGGGDDEAGTPSGDQ